MRNKIANYSKTIYRSLQIIMLTLLAISFVTQIYGATGDWIIYGVLYAQIISVIFLIGVFLEEYTDDYMQMNIIVDFLFSAYLINYEKYHSTGNMAIRLCAISLVVSLLIWGIKYIKTRIEQKRISINISLIILCVVFVLLNLRALYQVPKGDTAIYYNFIYSMEDADIFKDWAVYFNFSSHMCMGYSIFLSIAKLASANFNINVLLCVQICDMVIAVITIIKFYKIIEHFMHRRGKVVKTILTCVFVCSPAFLGLFWNVSLDYFMMCSLVWFISADISDQKHLKRLFGLMFVFSKEPAIFTYFVYVFVKYVYSYVHQIVKEKKYSIIPFLNLEFFKYLIPALMWVAMYVICLYSGSSWSETSGNSWTPNKTYLTIKLKQIFIMNFNWIAWGIILAAIIVFIVRLARKQTSEKLKKTISCYGRDVASIVGVVIGVIISNLVFATYAHMRYLQPLTVGLSILVILSIAFLLHSKRIVTEIVVSVYTVLIFIQSYVGIDMVSQANFEKIDVGNGKMMTSINRDSIDATLMGDAIAYNQEATYYEIALEQFLSKINYDGSQAIVYADIDGDWGTHYYLAGYFYGNFNWNQERQRLSYDDGRIINFIYDDGNVDLSEYKEIYYMTYPFANPDAPRTFSNMESYELIQSKYRTWVLDFYKIK